ncbi:hypothetical protein SMSP2_01073 [Limihaloglobus sulfuriphilus]|uniref:Uncharacterized protein n=2 Tax=Limihaloglobus sulfuriphilus TaxID=1851148 RepID=A0A1Q2MDD7_9BACT|nr:hypothetical protein SMSP2_01073 [Limihaloglobus sulfuriphilus]
MKITTRSTHLLLIISIFSGFCFGMKAANQEDDTQYIFLMRAPDEGSYQGSPESINPEIFREVMSSFPKNDNSRIKVGLGYIFSYLRTSQETVLASLRNFLESAQKTDTPVMIHLDGEHWWDARPDLWNWWDDSLPGYDPENRKNVEWTWWDSDYAIKISWRNWGRQLRVLPAPNLMSPEFLEANRESIRKIIPVILDWYGQLPDSQKDLFVGVKVGHETSLGANSWYYPNGNELLDQPESNDPSSGLVTEDVLSRGVTQIGYAAIKTAGIRTEGDITEKDLYEAARRYLTFLSKEAAAAGMPRHKLFTHGVGWKEGELMYDAAVNEYSCPGWSFYKNAEDPMKDEAVVGNLKKSDAPYWAAVEWLLVSKPWTVENWVSALNNTLADDKCKFLCIFNWESIRSKDAPIEALNKIVDSSVEITDAEGL